MSRSLVASRQLKINLTPGNSRKDTDTNVGHSETIGTALPTRMSIHILAVTNCNSIYDSDDVD